MNLFTIPFAEPFLDRLAEWGLAQGPALADTHFLLPTRRAARSLADAILVRTDGAPLLLPRITALGAPDETPLALAGALDLPPAVTPEQRLAVLSRLILAMGGRHDAPTTVDRAWPLAAELARLLDEAARAEIDLAAALPHAVGGDWAGHWQVTLDFLTIVTEAWPAYLGEAGLMDIAARQIALLDAQARAWEADPPPHPIVAAGTTGAIPAIARLLRVIARLKLGRVVLPGLDLELDEASWQALADTHPQAGLRALLAALDATRGDVQPWPSAAAGETHRREALLRRALLPAASLGQWRETHAVPSGLFELAAGDQQEEALAVALALRDAIETPDATAALVTPDRGLAERVAAELRRFGVVADDSAGEPLADTPPAVFLRLLASAVTEAFAPVALLSLLKHPLALAGLPRAQCLAAARDLERAALRGQRPAGGLHGLRARGDGPFLDRLEQCLAPLRVLRDEPPPHHALAALIKAAEALAGADRLWEGEEGAALSLTLAALLDALAGLPPQPLATLPTLLDAALAGITVRTRRALRGGAVAEHPRIFIWGLLEARLQSADLLVLGGLTEGTWPAATDAGPWMSRAMRAAVGLPSPELLVGQMAHDFASLACAASRVVLSHPARRDGKPAVPARWKVRLQALLAGAGHALAAHPALAWAGALDRHPGPPCPVSPPAPCPPVALRPRRLSVTEIETWLRDPYAIYARHVLGLRRLEPLEPSADAADYGSIVHAALADFLALVEARWPPNAEALLLGCMDRALDRAAMRPALAAWWRPRLARIGRWVADTEAERRLPPPTLVLAEKSGAWQFDAPAGPFTLRGRVDRIERRYTGELSILDYKTGTPPSAREVDTYAKQLPLEAVMLAHGAFGEAQGQIGELAYWKLSGGYEAGLVKQLFKSDPAAIAAATAEAEAGLRRLVADFDRPERAYLSQPTPGAAPRFAEFARLARVAEWAAADGTADDEDCE